MRPTWLILGVVVAGGTLAYLHLVDRAKDADRASASAPALNRAEPAAAPSPGEPSGAHPEEARALAILREIAAAHEDEDRARYEAAVDTLRQEAWDAPSARRFARRLGSAMLEQARREQGLERMTRLDEARRLLSRALYLDDLFDARGEPTEERVAIVEAIQEANRQVMTFARREGGGLAGVTRPFVVAPGLAPVQIVSRERLPYGPNALLHWNKGGNLDPRGLRAGETLLLPEETLHVEVHLARTRLALFLGDWLVKEFRVGIGRKDRPTPTGTFTVGPRRQRNPDWWGPEGFKPYGHPENELGSAWIPFGNDTYPYAAGFGIHGTNRPETVGTECSNGCVRLLDAHASELYDWVRTASAGGQATVIEIR